MGGGDNGCGSVARGNIQQIRDVLQTERALCYSLWKSCNYIIMLLHVLFHDLIAKQQSTTTYSSLVTTTVVKVKHASIATD